LVAGIMAFGAGALLSALSFVLILTAQEKGGFLWVAVGGTIGGVSFVLLNELLNNRGGYLRKHATTTRFLRRQREQEVREILEKLGRVSLFRALPPGDIQAVVPHVDTVDYPQGAQIFAEGDVGDALYLIEQGEVDLFARSGSDGARAPSIVDQSAQERIARLGPGEAFGEMALLTGEPRSATVVAASPVSLFRVPKDHFDALVAVSPGLSQAIADLLARNLQATSSREPSSQRDAQRWSALAHRYVEAHSLAPSATDIRKAHQEHGSSAGTGIFLGLMLDGIPESLVIGMSMIGAPVVSATLIVGLFLSNLPEALSSAVGMKAQGTGTGRILGMWTFLMVFIGVGAFIGNALFVGAPPALIAAFEAAAAGAMLTMIAETALPEAYEQGGWISGIATLMGFLAAFFVKTLSDGH
jgi:CRP-like cAMP-binding protein